MGQGLVTLRQVFSIIIVIGRRRLGYCRGMRSVLVAAARIDNLPKEADYRFCVKLRQRQARNLLRDAHCSERVKKLDVQFHWSLLEKETCSE